MALPTINDIVFSNIIADRILLRKNFEMLRDRLGSKYFKNIVIKDIEWNKNFELPSNFPVSFLEKYPYDFEISYDILGCNMLKCYKHDYSKPCGETPFLINSSVFACSEACYQVFEEFNQFLFDTFDITDITNTESDTTTTTATHHQQQNFELPMETLSIKGKGPDYECFCGMQLVDLKKFAIFPSARYENIDGIEGLEIEQYVEKYKDQPLKLSDMAGLVDAPPLNWSDIDQDIHFNATYCSRFVKKYDFNTDECYDEPHRKVLGYLFGENVVKLYPDLSQYLTGPLPIDFITDSILQKGLNIDIAYFEKNISQHVLEMNQFVDIPDKKLYPESDYHVNVINLKSVPFSVTELVKQGEELNSIIVDILKNVIQDVGIEAAVTQTPLIISKLLKYFAPKVLNRVLYSTESIIVPITTRLSSLLIRSMISQMSIQVATRALTVASSVASAVFAVSIVTMVPDFLISYYNLCGFNNEISRSQIDERKQILVDQMLKYLLDTHKTSFKYINIVNEKTGDHYISPLITPEYIYNLCTLNFINKYPDKKITIGFNGIDPVKHFEVSTEYITSLTENSAGQRIDLLANRNNFLINDTAITSPSFSSSSSSSNIYRDKLMINETLSKNKDIYWLCLGIILLLLSFIMGYIDIIAYTLLMLASLSCFSYWFINFKPQIMHARKKWFFYLL